MPAQFLFVREKLYDQLVVMFQIISYCYSGIINQEKRDECVKIPPISQNTCSFSLNLRLYFFIIYKVKSSFLLFAKLQMHTEDNHVDEPQSLNS